MDLKLIETLVLGLPNFAIAVWCLWRQQRTIDTLLAHQQKLLDRYIQLLANEPIPKS